ncbi:MAG: response regulator [Nannocystaceae bacterium]|nr:response regulator [bacterium]
MARRFTILLVDDDDADLMITARRLRSAAPDRYRLLQASNVEEASATLKVSPVDAVVLDLNLGTSSGPDTVARLRAVDETTLIVALTGHVTPELERACLDAGADQFLDKQSLAEGSEFMHALEFTLRKERPCGPAAAAKMQALLSRLRSTSPTQHSASDADVHPLETAAKRLAAERCSPLETFAVLLEEAKDSRDPSLTLGALAVHLAQAYFEASGDEDAQ